MPITRIEFDEIQETHLVTAGEVTAGYFTLTYAPSASEIELTAVGGPHQVNKAVVGASGAIPDFELRNNNQIHINNNGGASGLSGHIKAGRVVIVLYDYGVE